MLPGNCILCKKPLNDGIIINGRGICKSCIERMINLESNNDFYEYYKKCMKRYIVADLLKRDCKTNEISASSERR